MDYQLGDLELIPQRRSNARSSLADNDQESAPPQRPRAPRTLTLADGELSPTLELDSAALPARGSLPRPNAAKPSAAEPAALDLGRSAFADDFEEGFAELPSIEVEAVEKPRATPSPRESAPGDPKRSAAEEQKRIAALADFGPTPQTLLASVRYALHVTRRMIALQRARARQETEVKRCAGEHHAALVAMGEALMPHSRLKALDPLRTKLAKVQDEKSNVERARVGAERARDEHRQSLASLEHEVQNEQEKLAPFAESVNAAEAAHRKAQDELKRAQAMAKRVEIELRALTEATTPQDPARLDALTAQLEQRRAVITALTEPVTEAALELGRARRELALKQGGLNVLQERKGTLESRGRAREAEVEGQQKIADGALANALRELAEAAYTHKLEALVPEGAQRVAEQNTALTEAGDALARFDRALGLVNRSAVIKGYAVMVALLVGLVVAMNMRS